MSKSSVLPHWESFKKNLLPQLIMVPVTDKRLVETVRERFSPEVAARLTTTPAEAYEETLRTYKVPGIYDFQGTSLGKYCLHYCMYQAQLNEAFSKVWESQFRLLLEEAYAVATFEQQGCRIIRPSPALVMLLLNTATDFPLADVKAPWPHVYVELPKNVDLKMLDCYDLSTLRDVNGYYVTWAEQSEEALKAEGHLRKEPNQDISDARLKAAFGNWCSRFLIETVDNRSASTHERTVQFFSLTWDDTTKETVTERHDRIYTEFWLKEGIGKGDDELRKRIFTFTANLFMYMSLPAKQRDVVWKPDPERERLRTLSPNRSSKQRRNLKNRIREEMRTEAWEVGQTIVIDRRQASSGESGESGEGSGRARRTHWVRGHYHMYWHGQRDTPDRRKEVHWIMPYLIMGAGPEPKTTTVIVR